MAKNFEIERRFRIDTIGKLPKGLRPVFIRQGYFNIIVDDGSSLRTRIYGTKRAELTGKLGRGIKRQEESGEISVDYAEFLLDNYCPHRADKDRFRVGRWDVDFFRGILNGVIIAEIELESEYEGFVIPMWMAEYKEVTNTLTTHKLACLVSELKRKGLTKRSDVLEVVRRIS